MRKCFAAIAFTALALALAALPVAADQREPTPAVAVVASEPALALAVSDFVCAPTIEGWDTKAAWGDGSVMEARHCLQWDSSSDRVRVKSEWRARRGGTALSGTDWDLDSADDGRPWRRAIFDVYDASNAPRGQLTAQADILNASYIVRYSDWYCFPDAPAQQTIYGVGWDVRATPPGLTRSGYKFGQTYNSTTSRGTC